MQTKRKVTARNSARELASPKVSRHLKKVSESAQVQERNVTKLITSSARKQRVAKKTEDYVVVTNLDGKYSSVNDTAARLRLDADHATDNASVNTGVCGDGITHCMKGTIFSPPFPNSISARGEIESGADFIKYFQTEDQKFQDCGKENISGLSVGHVMQEKSNSDEDTMSLMDLACLDSAGPVLPEVSAIYLSMKNSKLDCVDEYSQNHISNDVHMEDNECEEFDDFDPYFFIKNLPDLSSVVPTFRPMLLPKQTRSCPPTTLVLDLDETLVHSTLESCDDADFTFSVSFNLMEHTVFVRCRPHLKDFLEKVSGLFEIIIFTASQSIYAEQLLNVLDPKRKVFRHRVFRESCVFVEGNYLKDLSVLGRDLAHVIMIDNSPQTRNLLRIAIFNISYIRGLFPENYFNDKSVPALEMKIKKLMPMDAESRRLIDWMEKGVYDALQKKYLKTLLFCVCETIEGPMIEEYSFSFSYSSADSQGVLMNVNRIGNKKQGGTFKCNSITEITPNEMRSSACKMVRTLIQLMRTLDKMPEERTIVMKLLYYDDVTPMDYEPPFFRGCTEEEVHNPWTKNPLKMEIGNVNSKHFVLALKVKSVLDPCEDENDDIQNDDVSLGADSVERDEDTESDNETSEDDQYIVAPVDKQRVQKDGTMIDEDDTQDPTEDEEQLGRVKEWISSYHLDTIEITDVLSNFSDISVVLTEEIMDKLVKEGILSKSGTDCYIINKHKKSDYEFDAVKEEMEGQVVANGNKTEQSMDEDHMYMKALYHALPMNYISISKLQNKLEGDANQATVRKLIDKMTKDGFVEAQSNRRLGKRVIHSHLTEKKLAEVKKILDLNAMDLDMNEPQNKLNQSEFQTAGSKQRDMSTCGVLYSVGSDLTRMRGKSDTFQNGSIRSEQTVSKMKEHGNNTPTSRAQPVASRESFAQVMENGRANGNGENCDEFNAVICSRSSTQNKRSRKASTVKEPILQYIKRQKSQVA